MNATLDDDVLEELQRLSVRERIPVDVLVNDVLRDYVRRESKIAASVERGISNLDSGRVMDMRMGRAIELLRGLVRLQSCWS